MKILFAVQGTGNGHVSRAMELLPILRQYAQVDVLISGIQCDLALELSVKYRYRGLGFVFGKKGGVDIYQTWKKNRLKSIIDEFRNCPVEEYDLVINDFEPITAWKCMFNKVPCVSVSHQSALLDANCPKPIKKDWLGATILRFYAPGHRHYGIHFRKYSKQIFLPVIRSEIRRAKTNDHGHITVYLPAYSDKKILEVLKQCPETKWQVFSKHAQANYTEGNVQVFMPSGPDFIKSMVNSGGIICGAGFETPAEALYMGKKLMVIPMKSQYEQHYNAAALDSMGVPVLKEFSTKKVLEIRNWLRQNNSINYRFRDDSRSLIAKIIEDYYLMELQERSSQPIYHQIRQIPALG